MNEVRIEPKRLQEFASSLLAACGAGDSEARVVAEIIVWCDRIGRGSQGIWRLPEIGRKIRAGGIVSPCNCQFEENAPSFHRLDGRHGIGHFIGHTAMTRAIELGKQTGVGAVAAFNSNYFGAGAWYVNLAADAGMIGIALSNSYPKVACHGGREPKLGTNPIAFAAPRKQGRNLMVDMATSQLAGSTIRRHLQNNEPLPPDVAVDGAGQPITDPSQVATGALLPFGGAKGFGLSLMVEILASVLSGAGIADQINSAVNSPTQHGLNGQLFVAIDIETLMPITDFHQRISLLEGMLKTEPAVRLPGDERWNHFDDSESNGVLLDPSSTSAIAQFANESGVSVPW